jgi:arginyl-tRNA synthetase
MILSDVFSVPKDLVAESIEKPPDSALGDLASTISFSLAKELKMNPAAVISEFLPKLKERVAVESMIKEVTTKGPYINFFFDHGKVAELTISSVLQLDMAYWSRKKCNPRRHTL